MALTPAMTFCYVTGKNTDSSEKGHSAWARVKGATKNALMRLLPNSFMFRSAMMKPTVGQKRVNKYYKYIAWVYYPGRSLFPGSLSTIQELAKAMIYVSTKDSFKHILEVEDTVKLAQ